MSAQQPSNRAIAIAIAELGEARLQAAAELDRLCLSLVASGLPRVELALALECDAPLDTESLRKISLWMRAPSGGLAVVGPAGCGKTFAAQRGVIARARAGLRSCWLPAVSWDGYSRDAQRRWIADGLAAQLLVVDDLGAGVTGSGGWVQRAVESEIEGMLMTRMGEGRPTLILANGSEASITEQLGGRLVSRMRAAGGFVFLPDGSPDLRAGVRQPTINTSGRWPRWQADRDLLELVGHDDTGSWHRLIRMAVDGGSDESQAASREQLRRVAALLELDPVAVRRVALGHTPREHALMQYASKVLDTPVEEYSFGGLARALAAKNAARAVREQSRPLEVNLKAKPNVWPSSDALAADARRIYRWGYSVTGPNARHEFDFRTTDKVTKHIDQKGSGYATADAAWKAAIALADLPLCSSAVDPGEARS